jgi:hypothetical protein
MSSSLKTLRSRAVHFSLAAVLAACAGNAAAFDFELFGTDIRLNNLVTVGASWRMQNPNHQLIGKSTLHALNNPGEGLCLRRDNGDLVEGEIAALCATSGDDGGGPGSANANYVLAPGSFSPNGDNGNLNFDKYDLVHAVGKITSDLSFSLFDFNVFVRGIGFFDANYTDFTQRHPDTTFQPAETDLPKSVERVVGMDFGFLDYTVSRSFDVFDRFVTVKVGNQVLNWGESALLIFNSLNSINPVDARRLRMPGFDLKELQRPVGMALVGFDFVPNIGIEAFYQYNWKPLMVDPVGTFFSQSDTLGTGGNYAMLGFAKNPEDPFNTYRPIDTCDPLGAPCVDALGLLGSTAGRTVYRNAAEEARRRPSGGGQYGLALKTFWEDFNNGTELNFYFANYHSRIPVVSAIAAQRSCLDSTLGAISLVTECGFTGPGVAADEEPIPVDTMSLIVEYPENVQMLGVSFNTTLGDYALSGEYAFRPNLPTQIHTVDLTFSALQPAFPEGDITVAPGTVLPGRQSAFPSFLTLYRGLPCGEGEACIEPGQYIRGYEELKTGQLGLTILRLIGGDNPIGASQMTLLFEMGMTHVIDMPGLNELQFQGGGTDTHISRGADGTTGIEPGDGTAVPGNDRADTLRQNPTAHADHAGFGTDISYGYRFINLNRWDSAIFGVNLETLTIVQHDVKGTAPGIGTNFTEGRKQYAFGFRGDYLQTWFGEIRYAWNTGGKNRDQLRDRDNIFVTLGYQF